MIIYLIWNYSVFYINLFNYHYFIISLWSKVKELIISNLEIWTTTESEETSDDTLLVQENSVICLPTVVWCPRRKKKTQIASMKFSTLKSLILRYIAMLLLFPENNNEYECNSNSVTSWNNSQDVKISNSLSIFC